MGWIIFDSIMIGVNLGVILARLLTDDWNNSGWFSVGAIICFSLGVILKVYQLKDRSVEK